GPPRDERQPQAALVQAELATAKINRAPGQVGIGAVVAGKNHERPLTAFKLLDARHESTDLGIHFRQYRLEVSRNVPVLLLLCICVRNPRSMNIVEPKIYEARLALVATKEIERLVDEELGALPTLEFVVRRPDPIRGRDIGIRLRAFVGARVLVVA